MKVPWSEDTHNKVGVQVESTTECTDQPWSNFLPECLQCLRVKGDSELGVLTCVQGLIWRHEHLSREKGTT